MKLLVISYRHPPSLKLRRDKWTNMEKFYNHTEHEARIYSLWEKSNAFTPKIIKGKKPFTIIMPPPNASDPLHIGHARFVTIEDILVRYHRMLGEPTLWLPGADHAGIETQYIYEKKLAKQGKSRFDFDRETLYKMIWSYVQDNKHIMESQLKKLGASCDWSRNTFTLEPEIVKIVYKTFKKLYDEGLIYRGERIVNYCPRCGTSFSQLEVNYIERDDPLYYLNYGTLTVATTRPETIFADVAVAVNPKDPRYKKLIGKKAILPLIGRELPIIADSLVDPKFATGALKVTPGHDAVDFEIGQKHSLPTISVIDTEGKMTNTPPEYTGLAIDKARTQIVADLASSKKIRKVESIHHSVSVCYRDRSLIEPLVSKQWFLKVKPLVKVSLVAVKAKKVRFVSERFDKIARHWLKNLKDWNISRQIVWGIRIPAWRCDKCLEWTITAGTPPKKCSFCGSEKLTRDNDTFDTWFSSGQWPFATLLSSFKPKAPGLAKRSGAGKSQKSKLTIDAYPSEDFSYFYPTSVMETGYDILPFWVIRMIMLGLYATGEVPFREVYLHGLVRDSKGEKISKSKGNVIDPIEMAEKYGADALRMALVWGTLVENDIALSEDSVRGQRNFANKIWNVSRFVFMEKGYKKGGYKKTPPSKHEDDKEIVAELKSTKRRVTRLLENYRLNEAAEELYDFFWNRFANNYLEKSKSRRGEAQKILDYVLQESLKLIHPFMPFITEVVWQEGKERFDSSHLISAGWPK